MAEAELIEPRRISCTQDMEVHVTGPEGANRMMVYTGIAEMEVKGGEPHPKWTQVFITFPIGRKFDPARERVLKTVATASIAGVRDDGVASFAGWRIYGAAADWDEESHHIRLNIAVGARDSQGYLEQVAWQVHVLAHCDC